MKISEELDFLKTSEMGTLDEGLTKWSNLLVKSNKWDLLSLDAGPIQIQANLR
jgi:hypothetical protein